MERVDCREEHAIAADSGRELESRLSVWVVGETGVGLVCYQVW